ncbi:regulatory LuxR family protein [Pseudosporangium ferrugineum]|uniref:Regulatory LuxR family protein n=1 Tax=Pseudosporangium ferrugineum TaxID=439699 RepID=A0A2T0RXE4_9ACTN|nr:regulatory LuxR family protein [Pseudosporangium ferrugineum]
MPLRESGNRLVDREPHRDLVLAAVAAGRGVAVLGAAGTGRTAFARAVAETLPAARYATTWLTALPVPLIAHLRERARGRVPVLVVDDAHELGDRDAVNLLALLPAVRLIITARPGHLRSAALRTLIKDHLRVCVLEPFDAAATGRALAAMLGGEAAGPAVDLLHRWTDGNPRLLAALVAHGHLRQRAGLWWHDPHGTPPCLPELFAEEAAGITPADRDVIAALSLGTPLRLADAEMLAPGSAERLEEHGVVRPVTTACRTVLHWTNPLLGAALTAGVPATRRQRVAALLLTTHAADAMTFTERGRHPADAMTFTDRGRHPVDAMTFTDRGRHAVDAMTFTDRGRHPADAGADLEPVVRARWHLAAPETARPGDLLRLAARVREADPRTAALLAGQVTDLTGTPTARLTYAAALTHLGDYSTARSVLRECDAGTPGERVERALVRSRLRCWADRDPAGARLEVASIGTAEVVAWDSLLLLLAGEPRRAWHRADALLETTTPEPAFAAGVRAVRAAAGALMGRPPADLPPPAADATASAVVAWAALWDGSMPAGAAVAWTGPTAPPAAPSATGQAVGPTVGPPADLAAGPAADLAAGSVAGPASVDGYARWLRGDIAGAVRRWREAVGDPGPQPLRTEAAAWLATCLAEQGDPDEAARILAEHAAGGLNVVPGAVAAARATIAAARGDLLTAGTQIDTAIRTAHDAGAALPELDHLIRAARWRGDVTGSVADRIRVLLPVVAAARLGLLGAATLALTRSDGDELLAYAQRLADAGLPAQACRFAESAAPLLSATRRDEARVLLDRLRGRPGPAGREVLTVREAEVAGLAATGLSDREISDRLTVSVRTVESHLSRVYRKLGVTSRRALRPAPSPIEV